MRKYFVMLALMLVASSNASAAKQEFDVRLFDGEPIRVVLDDQTGEVVTVMRALDAKAILPGNEEPPSVLVKMHIEDGRLVLWSNWWMGDLMRLVGPDGGHLTLLDGSLSGTDYLVLPLNTPYKPSYWHPKHKTYFEPVMVSAVTH